MTSQFRLTLLELGSGGPFLNTKLFNVGSAPIASNNTYVAVSLASLKCFSFCLL